MSINPWNKVKSCFVFVLLSIYLQKTPDGLMFGSTHKLTPGGAARLFFSQRGWTRLAALKQTTQTNFSSNFFFNSKITRFFLIIRKFFSELRSVWQKKSFRQSFHWPLPPALNQWAKCCYAVAGFWFAGAPVNHSWQPSVTLFRCAKDRRPSRDGSRPAALNGERAAHVTAAEVGKF